MLDTATGRERWRVSLGRTRKRGEGTPLGPLSTPAIDENFSYMQALDGRFVCVENQSGAIRWEVQLKRQFKAFEPGYGFAGSPLLLKDSVILMPSGSSEASVVSLERSTGRVLWQTALGSGTEYSSATFVPGINSEQVIVHVAGSMAGVALEDGRVLWKVDGVQGGLWTASVLANGRVFLPLGSESQLLKVSGRVVESVWSSPMFENIMGPVVEVNGVLVGHQKRKLTGVDVETGNRLWQLPEESDGQLIALGPWLIFFNDRSGKLSLLSVGRSGVEIQGQQTVMKSTRMETPLTFAGDTLYLRATTELVALKVE